MTTVPPAQCLSCTHLHPRQRPDGIPGGLPPVVSCDAYPDKIPADIAHGGDHRQPRGDEVDGIVHQLDPGKKRLFESWRKTFAPTDAELAARRMTMTEPVEIVFIEE